MRKPFAAAQRMVLVLSLGDFRNYQDRSEMRLPGRHVKEYAPIEQSIERSNGLPLSATGRSRFKYAGEVSYECRY